MIMFPNGTGYNVPSPAVACDFAKVLPANDKKIAPMLSASGTKPRAIWASVGEYLYDDTGNTQTNQFIATRVKARIAGGKWKALAPVFVGAKCTSVKSPFGHLTPAYTVAWNLELADGTIDGTYFSPNTGGTLLSGKFNGSTDGLVIGGEIVVGDFIYASDASLPYFQWTDRKFLPWIRCAFSKTSATDDIGAVQNTWYAAPWNSHEAICTSYATAKTLINTVGISSYNGGTDHWDSNDSASLPSCIGFIGIAMDGQMSLLFNGTSIVDGDGSIDYGVQSGSTAKNFDLQGYPCGFAQDLNNSVPVLNLGVTSSALVNVWSDNATDLTQVTAGVASINRYMIAKFASWFDGIIANDVNNDQSISGSYADALKNWTNCVRSMNPSIKIFGCRVPNGYVDISGATVAYGAGGLDPLWTAQDGMVTAGYWDGMLTTRDNGVNIFPDKGAQVTSTTTSIGSTTTLNDSGQNWVINQWYGSWVLVGGVKKTITANTATQLTFGATTSVGSGVAYQILGNTSDGGLHPNAFWQRTVAPANLKASLASLGFNMPYFTRTA